MAMGRPRIKEDRTYIHMRISCNDKLLIKQASKIKRQSISDYIRDICVPISQATILQNVNK